MKDNELRAMVSATLMIAGVIFLLYAVRFSDLRDAVLAFACAVASYRFWKMTYVK